MPQEETIMTKIQKVEDTLKDSMYKVDVLEKKLKTKLLTMKNRVELETKLEEIKEVLRKNEEKLTNLRKENTKSYMVAACLVFMFSVLWIISNDIWNTITSNHVYIHGLRSIV